MSIRNELTTLPTFKLIILLEHVRLGEEHLKKHFSQEQFNKLLKLGELNPSQAEAVQADAIEKQGNVAHTVNGFLTGIIGTWLGYIGFVQSRLESVTGFSMVICLAASI